MKFYFVATVLIAAMLVSSCTLEGPEERAIREMVETFITALDRGDDDLAEACLMDLSALQILNPSASARSDAESFMAEYMADLVGSYRNLKYKYQGNDLKFKDFTLGVPFYQYKGHSAFKDNKVTFEVDGEDVTLNIMKIVRVGDRWLIVSIDTADSY